VYTYSRRPPESTPEVTEGEGKSTKVERHYEACGFVLRPVEDDAARSIQISVSRVQQRGCTDVYVLSSPSGFHSGGEG